MLLLFILISLIYIVLQIWISLGWQKLRKKPPLDPSANSLPLSVIVCAHDEAPNLIRFLPSIFHQDYPQFEIIVVLDRCTDDSLSVIQGYQAAFSQLRCITIDKTPDDWASKKWAVTQGVAAARFEHLVFTDADCEVPPTWLAEVSQQFDQGTELVLGLGLYKTYPGWLNRFIRFETFYAAFQYIGMAAQGLPYMGVGRNLAYTQTKFAQHSGFEAFKNHLSGDDDLFVNFFGKSGKMGLMTHPDSVTYSEPKRLFGSWVRQKVRHLSASAHYSLRTKIFLASFHLAHSLHYGGLLLILAAGWINTAFLLVYVGRILISWYIFRKINGQILTQGLIPWYPILDILFFFYNLFMVPLGLIANPKWKKNQEFLKTP